MAAAHSAACASPLTALPDECTLHVLKWLSVGDIVAVAACCKGLRQLVADDHTWAELAEAKWGPAVKELKPLADADREARAAASAAGMSAAAPAAAPPLGSWQRFCYKRMSARTITPSPLALGQEAYPDPWQHICCCVMCSRTSGGPLIKAAIAAFFDLCPTPSAVLEVPDEALMQLLHPLGLQANRAAALKSIAHGWLATDFEEPSEFKGCGKFVTDSWRVFCRGLRDAKDITDTSLRAYLAWLQRQEQPSEDADEQEAAPRQRSRAKPGQRKQQQQQQQQQQDRPAVASGTRLTRLSAAAAAGGGRSPAQPAKQTRAAAAAAQQAVAADAAPKGSRAAGKQNQRSAAPAASRPGKTQVLAAGGDVGGRTRRHQAAAV